MIAYQHSFDAPAFRGRKLHVLKQSNASLAPAPGIKKHKRFYAYKNGQLIRSGSDSGKIAYTYGLSGNLEFKASSTKILSQIEYWPSGLPGKIWNNWRRSGISICSWSYKNHSKCKFNCKIATSK